MASCLPFALMFMVVSVKETFVVEAARFAGDGDCARTAVETLDSLNVTCLRDVNSRVTWTLTSEGGLERPLFDCPARSPCVAIPPAPRFSYSMQSFDHNISLSFLGVREELSGQLVCTETFANGSQESDTCHVNVVRVKLSPFEALENSSATAHCHNYPYAPSSLVGWTLDPPEGKAPPLPVRNCSSAGGSCLLPPASDVDSPEGIEQLLLGNCSSVNTCMLPHASSMVLKRPSATHSQVLFRSVDRRFGGGHLTCYVVDNEVKVLSSTAFDVYSNATVENCTVRTVRHNWTAEISCDVTKVFTSSGLYDYRVYSLTWSMVNGFKQWTSGYMFEGRRSYLDGLTSYVDVDDDYHNNVYYRGRVRFSWRLPVKPVFFSSFKMMVFFGNSANRTEIVNTSINITTPHHPILNCSAREFLPEMGEVPCSCHVHHNVMGSPPARLQWLLGNVVIATGAYGVGMLEFPRGKVHRHADRAESRCRLDWTKPAFTPVLASRVAFGPDNVTVHVNETYDAKGSLQLDVTCPVTGMHPMRKDMPQWGGPCQGQRGRMCTLTPTSGAEVDGKTVTCLVTNAANNGHQARDSLVIKLKGRKLDFPQGFKDFKLPDFSSMTNLIIGLGTALGVVTVAFVVVMLVLYRLGRLCSRSSYYFTQETPSRENQSNFADLKAYESHREVALEDANEAVAEPGVDNVVYERESGPI